MDLSAIKQKCLVVAVWDKDNKSHDDFMAGVSQHVTVKPEPSKFSSLDFYRTAASSKF